MPQSLSQALSSERSHATTTQADRVRQPELLAKPRIARGELDTLLVQRLEGDAPCPAVRVPPNRWRLVVGGELGHANLGITSIYLQGIDTREIVNTVFRRPPRRSQLPRRSRGETHSHHGKRNEPRDNAWAMSAENVERVRSLYAAFNRADFEAVRRAVDRDIEFIRTGGQAPLHGAAALREWMEPDAFEEQRFEPVELAANSDKVLVKNRFTGRGAGSEMELDFTSFAVFTLDEEGLATRLEAFLPHDEGEARKAAGLSG